VFHPMTDSVPSGDLDVDPCLSASSDRCVVVVDVFLGDQYPVASLPERIAQGGLISVTPILVTQVRAFPCGMRCARTSAPAGG